MRASRGTRVTTSKRYAVTRTTGMVSDSPVESVATRSKRGSGQDEEYGRDLVASRCQREAFHPIVRPGLGDAGTVLRRVPLLRGAYRNAGAAGLSSNKGRRGDSDGSGG